MLFDRTSSSQPQLINSPLQNSSSSSSSSSSSEFSTTPKFVSVDVIPTSNKIIDKSSVPISKLRS
jgi:hypothetical protein